MQGREPSLIDITLLDPDFAIEVQQLMDSMKQKGYKIIPVSGLRSLHVQAMLWRQSRPYGKIKLQIDMFNDSGCPYLADILTNVGTQNGPWATNALPGYSWHNWGKAVDFMITPGGHSDYKLLADTAVSLGMTAGYYFTTPDMDHIQYTAHEVSRDYTMKEINDHFNAFSQK